MEQNITADTLSKELANKILPMTIIIGICAVFGLLGNFLVMYVYGKKYSRSNFKYFVLLLCAIDLTSCVTTLPAEMYTEQQWYSFDSPWFCKVKTFFNAYTVVASALALLLIAFERYWKVCRPHAKQLKTRFARKLCISVLLVATLPAFPSLIFWGPHSYIMEFQGQNVPVVTCEKDDNFKETILPSLYVHILYVGPNSIIMFLMVILSSFIAKRLFCSEKLYINKTPQIRISMADIDSEDRTTSGKADDYNGVVESDYSETSDMSSRSDRTYSRDSFASEDDQPENRRSVAFVDDVFETKDRLTVPTPHPRKPKCSDAKKNKTKHKKRRRSSGRANARERLGSQSTTRMKLFRRTSIMLVLMGVFVVTTLAYLALDSVVSRTTHVLRTLTFTEEAVLLSFYRLYFINSIINPIVYGMMDPRFRRTVNKMTRKISGSLRHNYGIPKDQGNVEMRRK